MAVQIRRDGAVAVVTVDRPEALNALDTATKELLLTAVRELSRDDAVRAVILTGAGDKAFVAGADIAEMKDMTPEEARQSAALG
jgi:enoyl-CoA hydratase